VADEIPGNDTRAEWARAGLVAFAAATGQDPDDQEEVVTDLLADLRHYCDLAEISWDDVLRHADMHHAFESTGTLDLSGWNGLPGGPS
jgi:hypothetical protein